MKDINILPQHIELIGDSVENFYALGLKDKKNAPELISQLKSLVDTPLPLINKAFEELSKPLIRQMFLRTPVFKRNISAYAEGLDRPVEEIALCYLLPEIISSMGKWLPSTPFGCSSFFLMDTKNSCPMHGRILDFPLHGSYDKYARSIKTSFNNVNEIFSYSSAGMAYPSLTAMTNKGVSFALHQKYTDQIFLDGTPIFELVYQMLSNCDDLDSTLQYLKHIKSLTAWGFHLSFKNGDILVADIIGDQKDIKTYQLDEKEILYFGNSLLAPSHKKTLPFGICEYNRMREESAQEIIAKLSKKKSITDIDLLKSMASPAQYFKPKKSKSFRQSPITPSSVDIVCMTPGIGKSISINTSAPKFYRGLYLQDSNIFTKHKREIKKSKRLETPSKYADGITNCMKAQVSIDKKKIEEAYHYFQMGISQLEDYADSYIATLFFLALRFSHETHHKIQKILLMEFINLKDKLPEYLAAHNLLYIMRLEIIIENKTNIKYSDIFLKELQTVYTVESKIPRALLHITVSKFTKIRYDTLDFIYTHAID